MPDKKLTDKEIVKALECCSDGHETCDCCDLQNVYCCYSVLSKKSLDLINRQKAEIERLKKGWKADVILTADAKAEAQREFAERLKEKSSALARLWIDNELKELVGE